MGIKELPDPNGNSTTQTQEKMEVPYLVETLFVISLLVFMVAVILIIPTVYNERRLEKKNKENKMSLSPTRRKRLLKKFWRNILKKGPTVAIYSLTGQL